MSSRTKSHKTTQSKERRKDKSTKGNRKDTSATSSKRHSNKGKRSDEKTQYVDLYCAVYDPHFGNYYHWAFAINNPTAAQWRLFEVVQDVQDGPFTAVHRTVNPTNSTRCHQPLTWLGQMHLGWWDTLIREVATIPVPGEGLSWNCQDYVMDIWELMRAHGMVSIETWHEGNHVMMPYYGQDFGGGDSGNDEMWGDYGEGDEGGDDGGQEGPVLSEQFVYDSSSE